MKKLAKKKPFNPYLKQVDVEEFRRIVRALCAVKLKSHTAPRSLYEAGLRAMEAERLDRDLEQVLRRLHFRRKGFKAADRERLWMNLAIRLTRESS